MATNKEILDKLDDVLERTEELIKLQSAVGQIDKVVCEHDKVLYGSNHDNGFVTEIPMMSSAIGGIKRIGWIIVTAIVGGFVTMGFALFEAIKRVP